MLFTHMKEVEILLATPHHLKSMNDHAATRASIDGNSLSFPCLSAFLLKRIYSMHRALKVERLGQHLAQPAPPRHDNPSQNALHRAVPAVHRS